MHVECAFLQALTCGGGAGENGGGGGRPGGLEGRDMVDVRDSETSTKVERFCGCWETLRPGPVICGDC